MRDTVSTAAGLEWRTTDGLTAYPDAIGTMQERVKAIRAGDEAEQVWLLEHPPLYTAGTSADAAGLTDPDRFDTFTAGRGGQWTYHGPGQLVAYVMLDLTRRHGTVPARDTHAYVSALESWLIATLKSVGVQSGRREGRVGVWVCDNRTGADNKVAAIGVRITRWVSWHGIALNISPNLEHFTGIVPCGIKEHGVTSLRALGWEGSVAEAREILRQNWSPIFGSVSSAAALSAATPASLP